MVLSPLSQTSPFACPSFQTGVRDQFRDQDCDGDHIDDEPLNFTATAGIYDVLPFMSSLYHDAFKSRVPALGRCGRRPVFDVDVSSFAFAGDSILSGDSSRGWRLDFQKKKKIHGVEYTYVMDFVHDSFGRVRVYTDDVNADNGTSFNAQSEASLNDAIRTLARWTRFPTLLPMREHVP